MPKDVSKYDHLSKKELIAQLERKDADLRSKKFGLYWDREREPEKVVTDCEDKFPVLNRVKSKSINSKTPKLQNSKTPKLQIY